MRLHMTEKEEVASWEDGLMMRLDEIYGDCKEMPGGFQLQVAIAVFWKQNDKTAQQQWPSSSGS